VKDIILEILKFIAPLSVALVIFSQGLAISPGKVAGYFKERPWLMLRSLGAVLVLAPAVALALILLLKPPVPVAIGLAILMSCPPAPMMLSTTPKMGKGSAAFMASLHLSLAALAFATVPAVLYLMSIPLGFRASVDLPSMTWILARTILIPIGLGLAVRACFPRFADQGGRALAMAGMIGVVIVVLVALAALYPALLKMDLRSYLIIAAVCAAALAIGQLAGPADPRQKTTLAVECGVRHPVLALTIAADNFSRTLALPVILPCVLTFILVAMIYLFVRGRMAAAKSVVTPAIT